MPAPLHIRRRYWLAPLVVLAVAGTFVGGVHVGERRMRAREAWADAQLLSTAIDSVRANALDSLPSEELIRRAVAGMLRELHDPYAALLRPDSYEKYRGTLHGEGQGLGLILRQQSGSVSVMRVTVGSPGFVAGLRAGDRILTVDGVMAADGWGRQDTTALSATRADSNVLRVWRAPFGDTLQVTVRRNTWHTPAVTDQGLLTDSVGYVRLASITARSAEELERAVEALMIRGARSLVLDLRGNTGGLFEEGVNAAGLFLPRGSVVASLEGRSGAAPEAYRSKSGRWSSMPLTVLVDGNTASAAEVIAAALREYDRALLVGSRTYGKGVVQRVVRLSAELSLRLTTAHWLTPKGHTLVRRSGRDAALTGGLQPDVLLDDATRRDLYAVPRAWAAGLGRMAIVAADSLAMHALREGWATTPAAVLEARLRVQLAQMVPRAVIDGVTRAEWVAVATRLAAVRILEVERQEEALLRYAVREDAGLRAAIDIAAPGSDALRVLPAVLPAALPRRLLVFP